MATWFTSDLHFGHANVIAYCDRPFISVEQMNEALVTRWNAVVDDADTVYVLGDVAMGKINESLRRVERLAGTKHLVTGNHDRCFGADRPAGAAPARTKELDWVDRYLDAGFDTVVHGDIAIDLGPHVVRACHFPYAGDSGDRDRYTDRRPVDRGQWLLHGHVHEKWRQRATMINVGVDAWGYAPVAESTLMQLIADAAPPTGAAHFSLDGAAMQQRGDLWDQLSSTVLAGVSWGRNLDALSDVLSGGFDLPDDIVVTWHDAASARSRLPGTFDVVLEILRDCAVNLDRHGGAPQRYGPTVWIELR